MTKTEVREIRNKPNEEIKEIAKQIEPGTYERPKPSPRQEPEVDWVTRKKQIAQHVAELKDDSIDQSLAHRI